MNYKEKYLKYKLKYLKLSMIQKGGTHQKPTDRLVYEGETNLLEYKKRNEDRIGIFFSPDEKPTEFEEGVTIAVINNRTINIIKSDISGRLIAEFDINTYLFDLETNLSYRCRTIMLNDKEIIFFGRKFGENICSILNTDTKDIISIVNNYDNLEIVKNTKLKNQLLMGYFRLLSEKNYIYSVSLLNYDETIHKLNNVLTIELMWKNGEKFNRIKLLSLKENNDNIYVLFQSFKNYTDVTTYVQIYKKDGTLLKEITLDKKLDMYEDIEFTTDNKIIVVCNTDTGYSLFIINEDGEIINQIYQDDKLAYSCYSRNGKLFVITDYTIDKFKNE
jgi:hypothetical protein